jgi:hypothetical protein
VATHKDMQGKTLRVGDTVAYVSYHIANSLVIGKITALHKVRADVETKSDGWTSGYTSDTLRSDQLIKLVAAKPQSAKILAFPGRT